MHKGEPTRVVIAEDDYLVSEEIIRSVRAIGFDVVGDVSTGRQAVELVQATKPDLVLMDIQMPEMDGIEAARQIQETQPTPVLILTAQGTQDMVEKASDAGVVGFLTKPPDPSQIERAAHIALARFRDMMEIHRLNEELVAKNWRLQDALDRIETLEGILPICASCKKIPEKDGEWIPLDTYLRAHTKAELSHGLCPTCEGHFVSEIDALSGSGEA